MILSGDGAVQVKLSKKTGLTIGEKTGIASIFLAVFLLGGAGPAWSILPLIGFVLLCFAAPFATCHGFFLPLICRGARNPRCVAITFDDGPDSVTTSLILETLQTHQVSATFFVTGKRAVSHPELVARILEQGHTIGNHTYSHDPLIMLKSSHCLEHEIAQTQKALAAHGIRPLAFRPPAGITNPKLGPVLAKAGLITVNFSCRAMDAGNRNVSGIASKILKRVKPGDIVMLHDLMPREKSQDRPDAVELARFLTELERVFAGLEKRNLSVVPLSELIGRPVMKYTQPHSGLG